MMRQESGNSIRKSLWLKSLLLSLVVAFVIGGLCDSVFAQRRNRGNNRNNQRPSQESGKLYGWDPEDTAAYIERDEFVEIRLNKDNKYAILHVFPVLRNQDGEKLNPPYNLGQPGFCVFRFANDTSQSYQVPWSSIEKISTFEDLVLAEANRAMKQLDLDTAFKGYLFLYDRNRVNPQIRKALENYLFVDGQRLKKEGKYSDALTVFEELYDRNPRFVYAGQAGGLVGAISECYDKMIEQKADSNDLPSIRKILTFIEDNYGERMEDITKKWRGRIVDIGKAVLDDAREAAKGDDPFEAHRKVRVMMHAVPEISESEQLFGDVIRKFPYVFVGVAQKPNKYDSSDITHFADRRVGRLTHRNLIEFLEPGDEGGKYVFPSGRITPVGEQGLKYKFEIAALPGQTRTLGVPDITAYQVSSRLLNLGDKKSPEMHLPWARIVRSIEIQDEKTVLVNLRFPHVRPESLLQVPYRYYAEKAPDQNGFYVEKSTDGNNTLFELNPNYAAIEGRQHPKIIERKFRSRSQATEALVLGEVDAVDRVFPLDIRKLKANPDIEVKPYNLPTIHMLVPNQRNDYMKSRDFRIGLLYGLNRELILKEMLAGGREIEGFEVISGPFPIGAEDADQTAYGYNFKVKPSIYNIYLGITMVQFAQVRLTDQLKKRAEKIFQPDFDLLTSEDPKQALLKKIQETVVEVGNDEDELITALFPEVSKTFPESDQEELEKRLAEFVKELPAVKQPPITIAYPEDDLAELAVESIGQMWKVIGIDVKLRRLKPGLTIPPDDDWDFLFTEITMHEPLLDIAKILGQEGLSPDVSASIKLELFRLGRADRWSRVFESLKAIHRHSNAEMAVLPLWQVMEHYAYRKNLKNTGTRISNLYQNVDRWQLDPPKAKDDQ